MVGAMVGRDQEALRQRPGAGDHDDTDAEYIATPSGHPTPEAAIDFIKRIIDGLSVIR